MSIVVEHDKRRHEILENALEVFMEDGYEEVTLQKIAERCGITRTTLYIYFKNKREIFNFSTKQFLEALENDITGIRNQTGLSHSEKLIAVMTIIINRLEENNRLLMVFLNHLIYHSKADSDPTYRLRRRTVRLRHILATILIEGIKAGEFSSSIKVKEANELFYSFVEAAAFRMVVLRRPSVEEIIDSIKLAVRLFAKG